MAPAYSEAMATERIKESVWDYPRPPRVESLDRHVRIELGGETIAESDRALRVLETASPPTIYVPREDVREELLSEAHHETGSSSHGSEDPRIQTFCEWKGTASYVHAEAGGKRAQRVAWYYPEPKEGFEQLVGHLAFYPRRVDAAYLDDELVTPQPGAYYGGWITEEIEGPFKGEPGSEGW
jgi:uncharacterized protein (DUF427 family)